MFWNDQIETPVLTLRDEQLDNVLREHVKPTHINKVRLFFSNYVYSMIVVSLMGLSIFAIVIGSMFASWNYSGAKYEGGFWPMFGSALGTLAFSMVIGWFTTRVLKRENTKYLHKALIFSTCFKMMSKNIDNMSFDEYYSGAWSKSQEAPAKPTSIVHEGRFDAKGSFVYVGQFRDQKFEFTTAKWKGGVSEHKMHLLTKKFKKQENNIATYVSQIVITDKSFKSFNGVAIESNKTVPDASNPMFELRDDLVELQSEVFNKAFNAYGDPGSINLLFGKVEQRKYIELFKKFHDVSIEIVDNSFKIYFPTPRAFQKKHLEMSDLGRDPEEILGLMYEGMTAFLDVFSYFTCIRNLAKAAPIDPDSIQSITL